MPGRLKFRHVSTDGSRLSTDAALTWHCINGDLAPIRDLQRLNLYPGPRANTSNATASGSCGLLRLPRPTSPTLCHDLSLCHHSWGFPTSWGNPQQLDGFCEGKSHLEMDDGWGYPRKPPKETAARGWSKTVLICFHDYNHIFDDWKETKPYKIHVWWLKFECSLFYDFQKYVRILSFLKVPRHEFATDSFHGYRFMFVALIGGNPTFRMLLCDDDEKTCSWLKRQYHQLFMINTTSAHDSKQVLCIYADVKTILFQTYNCMFIGSKNLM